MSLSPNQLEIGRVKPPRPFRRAVLRGLAVILPPLLTIAILIWVWNAVQQYVLVPVESGARISIAWAISDNPEDISNLNNDRVVYHNNVQYRQLEHGQYVPLHVYDTVRAKLGTEPMPNTTEGIWRRYVDIMYLPQYVVIPVFLCVFVLLLYLLGKFLAGSLGRMLWNFFELVIHRLPIIRNVYSSVKQVTDFVFSEQEVQFTRVVAVEYPRKGIWSIGFVTGQSLIDIRSAANEDVLTVLIPTSPMPVTGFTITVRKSDTVDLDVSIDQAIQFIVSCGVVIPPQQLENEDSAADEENETAASDTSDNNEPDGANLSAPVVNQPSEPK